jgi:hypothetical protein
MTTGGFLLSPRVRVLWGDINLSAYNGKLPFPQGAPLVYDVEVDLQAEGEGPTGSFKWDPTGPGMKVYELFVTSKEYMQKYITVEFFYPQRKKMTLFFTWAGQSINYGNDMTITVKLQSRLSGLVNANQRNVAQSYEEKKGSAVPNVYDRTQEQYGVKGIVEYNEYALQHLKTVKLENVYANDSTLGSVVGQIAKQTGDQTFPSNIGTEKIIIFPPYSQKTGGKEQEVLNGATDIGVGQAPDPKKRYGYVVGPAVFNTLQRDSTWKPPQQSNDNTPGSQPFAKDPKKDSSTVTQNPPAQPQTSTQATTKPTSSPLGTSSARPNPGVRNKDNPLGPDRQNALNNEKSAKLQMDTLMCPVLVGIKPHDIIFVPSLTGDFMEDWIVQSVGYSQNNGQVNVNIAASRIFGNASPMNKAAYNKFLAFAKNLGLVGPNANLEAWDLYAWGKPGTPGGIAADGLTGTRALSTEKLTPGGIF